MEADDAPDEYGPTVNDEQLNEIFDREDVHEDNIAEKLLFLQQLAQEIAEETYSDVDTSMEQLQNNLVSLIGQKSVEMNMLASIATMNAEQIYNEYHRIFNEEAGLIEVQQLDIREAAECVRRSRKIFLALREAENFEENFTKRKSKIPATFFQQRKVEISMVEKAMIFVIHYILQRKSQAKHVKQFLKKNSSFRAFGVELNGIQRKLTEMGLLTTERRVKRRRVLRELHPRVNEVRIVEETRTFFKILFDNTNTDHNSFLEKYQVLYPGESLGV